MVTNSNKDIPAANQDYTESLTFNNQLTAGANYDVFVSVKFHIFSSPVGAN